jgi:hypothetical protein
VADKKISELADGAPAVATDQLPIARAGATKRLTLADLQALASVTSNEVSAVAAAASVAVNVVSNALSNELSVRAAAINVVSNAASNALSVANAASNAASNALSVATAASNAASIVSVAVDVVSNALSNELSVRAAAVNVVSNALSDLISAHNVLSNRVSVNSAAGPGGSVTSAEVVVADDAISAQAASAINVVSAALANEISVRTSAVNAVSNAASNALSVANAASAAVNVVSNALSNEISIRTSAVNAVSNALSNEISNRASAVNVVSNALSDLISAHNVLSNRVSANSGTGGAGSVTSAELVAGDDAVSAQAASAASVLRGTVRVLANAFTVSTASALIDVSGMSAPLLTGGVYRLEGVWMTRAQSAAQVLSVGYGLTFPSMTNANGRVAMQLSAGTGAPQGMTSNIMAMGFFDENATGSTIVIGLPGASANLSRNMMVTWEGLFVVAGDGSIQLQARAGSVGVNAPVIQPGSYMRVVRLN